MTAHASRRAAAWASLAISAGGARAPARADTAPADRADPAERADPVERAEPWRAAAAQPDLPPRPTPSPPIDAPAPEVPRLGMFPDLTIGGGLVLSREGEARAWMARARLGALIYAEPGMLAVGVSGQFTALRSASLGVEIEYVDLARGFWIEGGAWPIDSRGGVIATAAAGFMLFGLQLERRLGGAHAGDLALTLVVHLPIGALAAAQWR